MPMPISKTSNVAQNDYAIPAQKQTSITAHTVITISVVMSIAEAEILMETFGRDYTNLNKTEKAIQRDYIQSVREALR